MHWWCDWLVAKISNSVYWYGNFHWRCYIHLLYILHRQLKVVQVVWLWLLWFCINIIRTRKSPNGEESLRGGIWKTYDSLTAGTKHGHVQTSAPVTAAPVTPSPTTTPSILPTLSTDCRDFDGKKLLCNKQEGCAYRRQENICLDSLPAEECEKFDGAMNACKDEGCKWDKTNKTCKARW